MTEPRRVLITGSSRGLGRALAEHYLTLGDRVIGCARHASTLSHDNYQHLEVDLTSADQISWLMSVVRDAWGGLDVLINNAGTARMLPVALTPSETVRRIMELNFLAPFNLCREGLRLLRRSRAGRIVNLTTIAVPTRLPGEAAYSASKAALEQLTRTLAYECGPLNVTCNALGPSPIRTDLIKNVPERQLETLIARQAIARWAEPADVINAVDFFLRPESHLITGQVIYLGGFG